jgi:hypothetical protein
LATIALRGSRFGLAEHKINHFAVEADADTTVEDLLRPEYWANVAPNLRPHGGDEITVICEDMSFRAHLWVVNAGHTWANVQLIGEPIILKAQEAKEISVAEDSRVFVQWRGPHDRWCVMRREMDGTKTKIKVGLSSREDAEREGRDHLKVILKRPKAAE